MCTALACVVVDDKYLRENTVSTHRVAFHDASRERDRVLLARRAADSPPPALLLLNHHTPTCPTLMSEAGPSNRPTTPPPRGVPNINLQLTPEQVKRVELNRLRGASPFRARRVLS